MVALLVAGTAVGIYAASRPAPASSNASMTGSMFVSDAGRSHGGFEYTASWNATLDLSGATGTLNLLLKVGLGDALSVHQFAIAGFTRNSTNVSMRIDGRPVTLVWIENDPVWNGTFDRYYVGSWGSDAPQNELRGAISPSVFPGLNSAWYIELRLH